MVFKGSPGALWGMLFSKNIRNGWEFSPTLYLSRLGTGLVCSILA
jgi:hypothetical protein